MPRLTIASAALLVLVALRASAVVWPQANHIQNFTSKTKHPEEGVLVVPVPTNLPSSVGACVEYGSTRKAPKKATITATLTLRRDGAVLEEETQIVDIPRTESPEEWEFSRSYYRGCGQPFGTRLREGDAVIVALRYEGLRILRKKDQFVLSSALGIVSVTEEDSAD